MRQTSASADHFNLLPFIAIMLCVMGCLLLVTVSIAAISLSVGAGEAWVAQGISTDKVSGPPKKTPVLVEWDGSRATFHFADRRAKGGWTMPRTKQIQLGGKSFGVPEDGREAADKDLRKLLAELKEMKSTHYALVAVRPSGFPTLLPFLEEFREAGITVGYEPIDQYRPVSLRSAQEQAARSGEPQSAQ